VGPNPCCGHREDTATDLVMRQVGQAKELVSLDLCKEQQLAALVAAVDLSELEH
jgi:hypothetical protein